MQVMVPSMAQPFFFVNSWAKGSVWTDHFRNPLGSSVLIVGTSFVSSRAKTTVDYIVPWHPAPLGMG